MFVNYIGFGPIFAQYARAYPSLPIIIDHCGIPRTPAEFDEMLKLAAYPNFHLKWGHGRPMFKAWQYSFPEVRPHLRRALDAYGRERIMWAGDFTAIPYGSKVRNIDLHYTWADALYYMRDNPDLSDGDKEWVLGRAVRKILDWLP